MYTHLSKNLLETLLSEFRILYLTGPRQAGKITLARQIAIDLGIEVKASSTVRESDFKGIRKFSDLVVKNSSMVWFFIQDQDYYLLAMG